MIPNAIFFKQANNRLPHSWQFWTASFDTLTESLPFPKHQKMFLIRYFIHIYCIFFVFFSPSVDESFFQSHHFQVHAVLLSYYALGKASLQKHRCSTWLRRIAKFPVLMIKEYYLWMYIVDTMNNWLFGIRLLFNFMHI
jgi:hypothetical protein